MYRSEITINNQSRIGYLLAIILLFSICNNEIYANKRIANKLYKTRGSQYDFEINEIRFFGNKSIQDIELKNTILSKISSKNPLHDLFLFYYESGIKNKSAPKTIISTLRKSVIRYSKELRYFDERVADNDTTSIINYYHKNGFHDAHAYYYFNADNEIQGNVLTFIIKEGKRTRIADINYIGLESLDSNTRNKILSRVTIRTGDYFNEDKIASDLTAMQSILLDEGYFYARISKPEVYINSQIGDSVEVRFSVGKRQTINKIEFIDSIGSQTFITNDLKREMVEFKVGEYYNRNKFIKSQDNLKSLGVFDVVKVDTLKRKEFVDSTLDIRIFTQYSKQQDWGLGLFTNQFANPDVNEMINAGFQLDYGHKNLGGAAQLFRPFSKIFIRDISNSFDNIKSGRNLEFEYQLGFRLTQPIIFTVDKARFGLEVSPIFSRRSINNIFPLQTFSLPIRLPIKLPSFTMLNNIIADFTMESQKPINYQENIAKANLDLPSDSLARFDLLYRNLDDYVKGKAFPITSLILGLNWFGDKRNDPFSPTKGYYLSFFGEVSLAGLSNFYKTQATLYYFEQLNNVSVLATKFRIGFIDYTNSETRYVPIERQFFAGGANSIRGWDARRLRYSNSIRNKLNNNSSFDFLQEFVGSRGILEMSLEYRVRFLAPDNYDPLIAYNINQSGLVFFLDGGNAYNWFVPQGDTQINSASEFFKSVAVAGGFGYRYSTPIGPLRLDFAWPLYDPLGTTDVKLGNFQFHVAFGHAF